MNNISLGRYIPYNTPIHKMDPRFKVIALIFLMVAIFIPIKISDPFANLWMSLVLFAVNGIIIFTLMMISKVGIRSLFGQLKALWIMMLFVTLINIFMLKDDTLGHFAIPLWNDKSWVIYWKAIYQSFYVIYRLILMVSLTMILTATTTPLDLTSALEWYMTPLKVIHFPAHEIAMTISITLRFIPTLLDETQRIMKAQASRGVDFQHGKFKDKIRAIVALIIPLFLSAFQRSEELANAMEARGYVPGEPRTKYRTMRWHARDTVSLILVTLFLAGVITLSVTKFDLIAMIGAWF